MAKRQIHVREYLKKDGTNVTDHNRKIEKIPERETYKKPYCEPSPTIQTVAGIAKLVRTEYDTDGHWKGNYNTKDGYWVVHDGSRHHIYQVANTNDDFKEIIKRESERPIDRYELVNYLNKKVFDIEGKRLIPIWEQDEIRTEIYAGKYSRYLDVDAEIQNRYWANLKGIGKKKPADVKDERDEEVSDIKPGTILYSSWGYDMTINDYCIVLENTGKTLLCRMLDREVTGDSDPSGGSSKPIMTQIGEPFRLKIESRDYPGVNATGRKSIHIRGSYPYSKGDKVKRFGYFSVWKGDPNYYNTWD